MGSGAGSPGPSLGIIARSTSPRSPGAHALTGDLDTAARTGHHAVQEITALASPRAYDRLRTLHTVLQPHTTTPAVNEVRNQSRPP